MIMITHEGSTPSQSPVAARWRFNAFREDYYRCLTPGPTKRSN